MGDYVLERRLWLPRPRPEVFAFFADARNLSRVTPPVRQPRWLRPPPEALAAGDVMDFSVRLAGWPVRWRVFIREFDPPYRFVDVAIWGPFTRWEHRHRFIEGLEADDPGGPVGTWIEDRVTYRVPIGALGRLAHGLVVRRRIAAMFAYRDRRLREIFGSAPVSPPLRGGVGEEQRR
jgi:ligand-binding SRPBCC domain-containing protein